MCKQFGQLPQAGGVLDQPARLMFIFDHITACEAERDILEQKRKKNASNST